MIFFQSFNCVFARDVELSFWFSSGFSAKERIEEMVAEYNAHK